jgi:hypothetical protein
MNYPQPEGSEKVMTVLGAVVFGGFLALGVLWLLMTGTDNEGDQAWDQDQWQERSNSARVVVDADVSNP